MRMIFLLIVFCASCASRDHLRETIQKDHPECFVFEDLTIECPDPFAPLSDHGSAGFGTEVKSKKRSKK